MTTFVLLRHGETDWNAQRRVQGWTPTPLNENGREQATAVGRYLAATDEFDRFVASDLRRTRETAELLSEAGVEPAPTFDSAWRERDFGVYQGLTYETMFSEHPDFAVGRSGESALAATPEGGESLLDLRERVLDAFERLAHEAATDDTVLIVTHGGVLYALLSYAKPTEFVRAISEGSQDNCAVNEVVHENGEFAVVRENDTSYRN